MVFDKQGKFVNGLKQDQLSYCRWSATAESLCSTACVNGRSEAERASAQVRREKNKPAPRLKSRRTYRIAAHGHLLHQRSVSRIPAAWRARIRTISYFIDKQMGPNDQVAITCASGQIGFLQQLTNNKAVLRAALDRLSLFPALRVTWNAAESATTPAYVVTERHDRQLFEALV
jgi:hypothetical protein